MIFRSEVSSCASRPVQAMTWINEIESAKYVADLKRSCSIVGQSCRQTLRFLSRKLRVVSRRSSTKLQKKGLHSLRSSKEREKRFLTGRQVAWMIYEYFKVSDTEESVLDLNEISEVGLKNDNVQSFNTRWDETTTAMKKQPNAEILDSSGLPPSSTVRTAQATAVSVDSGYCSESRIEMVVRAP